MPNYNSESITPHSWPPLERLNDGRWQRVWTISLVQVPTLSESLEELSTAITEDILEYIESMHSEHQGPNPRELEDDIQITLKLIGPRQIFAALVTIGNGAWDEYTYAAWRMLRNIDEMIGTIETIDGHARSISAMAF